MIKVEYQEDWGDVDETEKESHFDELRREDNERRNREHSQENRIRYYE
jgi:hypothetical protein